MRKSKRETRAAILVALVFIMLLIIVSLIGRSYRVKYQKGYEAGYEAGRASFGEDPADAYARGYDDGYSLGYWMGSDESSSGSDLISEIEQAADIARDKTGWSVYEAWNGIMIYHDGVDPYGFDLPTEEEYREFVETLVIFCDYLERINYSKFR